MARFVRPAASPPAALPGQAGVDPSDFLAHYPTLFEFLTLATWEDGAPRDTPTLTLFQGEVGLQAALNDKDSGMVAFVTGRSFTALLGLLEEGLVDGSLQWRPSRNGRPSRKRA
jgi:hypothetical protein